MATPSISFARGAPSLDIIDVDGLSAAATRAFANDPAGATAYGTSVGYVPLRRWIAERHGVDAAQVLVTNGSMQADAFLFDELVGPGDEVVVESPSYDRTLLALREHWLVRETLGLLRRTLARLDVTSRSLYAIVEPASCFVGTLLELALAADRTYMLALPNDDDHAPAIALGDANFGAYPMVNGRTRLETRFDGDLGALQRLHGELGRRYHAEDALDAGLITVAPDELDWGDEIRLALEERASLSPDALTAMEANLRFPGAETAETKIFGRLSAWQNWVFYRPNSTGDTGALKLFGSGTKPRFDQERV